MKYILFSLLLITQISIAQTPKIPAKTNRYINDYTNSLSSNEVISLQEITQGIEIESSAQVVVVITNDVPNDYPIEQYSIDLAQSWGIGQRSIDNGLLILICPNNRKSRIEVGDGLEGMLTDAYTKNIQVNHFRPNFREGNYYLGILNALQAIKIQISPEAREQKKQYEAQQQKEADEAMHNFGRGFLFFILFVIVVGLIIYGIIKYQEKKKEEEEKARRERDRLAYEAQRIAREKQVKLANSQTAIKTLESKYDDIKLELIKVGKFLDANVLLNEISTYVGQTLNKIKETEDVEKHPAICKNAQAHIQTKASPILKKYDVKLEIEAAASKLSLSKIESLYNTALRNIEYLSPRYSAHKYNLTYSSQELYDMLKEKHANAIRLLNNFEFDKAIFESSQAETEWLKFKSICDEIASKRNEVLNAIEYTELAEGKFYKAIEKVDRLSKHDDVSQSVRNNWYKTREDLQNSFKVDLRTGDPIKEQERITKIISTITTFETKCQNDINYVIAEKERQKREEENRKRRQREEEEEEERRRRRRREEEEEEDRRRRNSSSTDWSSSSSSWSSSSNDDSSSSFGGGSFSGGGSSDNW